VGRGKRVVLLKSNDELASASASAIGMIGRPRYLAANADTQSSSSFSHMFSMRSCCSSNAAVRALRVLQRLAHQQVLRPQLLVLRPQH
jgi:hypothetical protein